MEAVPQVHILVAIYFRNKNFIINPTDPSPLGFINQQDLFFITLAISVFSGSFGIAKFLKIGPCKILPSDKLHFGFALVFLSIATTLCAKACVLALVIKNRVDSFVPICFIWICTCVLPQLIFVSTCYFSVCQKKIGINFLSLLPFRLLLSWSKLLD